MGYNFSMVYTLRSILFNLMHQATKSQGVRFSKTLRGGLTITVMVYDGETWLALSRPNIEPSQQEIDTMIYSWPYSIPLARTVAVRGFSTILKWTTPPPGQFVGLPHPPKSVSMETHRPKEPSVKQLSFFDEKAPEPTGGF